MISPTRTFYLQAESPQQVSEWVKAITDARTALLATTTQNSVSTAPIPIPRSPSQGRHPYQPPVSPTLSHSHSPYHHHLTSSDSEDNSPSKPRTYSSSGAQPSGSSAAVATADATSPSRQPAAVDASKTILTGYLMKCGSRRHTWHNRWFVLSGDKGFDPLLNHLNCNGMSCRRVESIAELVPANVATVVAPDVVVCPYCKKASTIEHPTHSQIEFVGVPVRGLTFFHSRDPGRALSRLNA